MTVEELVRVGEWLGWMAGKEMEPEGEGLTLMAVAEERGEKKGGGRRATAPKGWINRRVTWKQLGEMAEAKFVGKMAEIGMGLSKPWGDSERYDFIVDTRAGLSRVQVKSAHREGKDRGYGVRTHGHSLKAYRAKEVDALVAYVVPEDAWYVFPIRAVGGRRSVKLYPGSRRRRSKFEKYREAWDLLRRK